MNQRDSSGLPLRAMVMVLLFLGVVFLLVGFQSIGSGDNSSDQQSSVATTTATAATTKTSAKAEPAPEVKADVRVYNISEVPGAAETAANQLREAHWNVTETGNLALEGVAGTTVFFGEAPGEKDAAEAVGKVLHAPVEPRRPELVEQPPGVIVVVTG